MTQSQDQLLQQAIDGDRSALVTLLEKHGPRVRQIIYRKIPQCFQSVLSEDDVMQQTYADAVRGIEAFVPKGEHSFAAWLTRLAQCNLQDVLRMLNAAKRGGGRLRAAATGSEQSAVDLVEMLSGSVTNPGSAAARNEAIEDLTRAIELLPPAYRQVIELYDLKGQSVETVADSLNRSNGATYLLRIRAHDRLRKVLGTFSKYFSTSG